MGIILSLILYIFAQGSRWMMILPSWLIFFNFMFAKKFEHLLHHVF